MSKILVAGLVNVEVTCKVDEFPIPYEPIDYNFFGVNIAPAGVGYNIVKALKTLGDEVEVATMVGNDFSAKLVLDELESMGTARMVSHSLSQTPSSVVLYDKTGRRKIYCDLKDIQDKSYDFSKINVSEYDLVSVCNINYSRPLLKMAREAGVKIATDVHVLTDIEDEYNKEYMENADILFLSNEGIIGREKEFVSELVARYDNEIIVVGCGKEGALMYVREEAKFYEMPAAAPERIVNTVGAGDCLFSTFVSMYTKKETPLRCLELAQKAAAHKIGFDGAAVGFATMTQLIL